MTYRSLIDLSMVTKLRVGVYSIAKPIFLAAPGKEAYQKLARRIEKWSRATTLAEYSPVVEPDAASLWNQIVHQRKWNRASHLNVCAYRRAMLST